MRRHSMSVRMHFSAVHRGKPIKELTSLHVNQFCQPVQRGHVESPQTPPASSAATCRDLFLHEGISASFLSIVGT